MNAEHALWWVKKVWAKCAAALNDFSCSYRLMSTLIYGRMRYHSNFEYWLRAVQALEYNGLSVARGGGSDQMSCMRLNIVIMSCLSVTFIRLLIRLMGYLLPSRWCRRTGGVIWTPPIEIPLGLRCACQSHFITCL